jgi:hypothetical protein
MPILDDRSYQQLRDELIRRIPVYAREWTDHNASDPGITLIELFAFLGENLLYRFNQIPDATKLAFLNLLQVPLRPATAARALITLMRVDTGPTAGAPVLVDAGSEAKAGNVLFETLVEVAVYPLSVIALARAAASPPTSGEAKDALAAAIAARGGIKANEEVALYQNALVATDPSAPGATPVDFRRAVDGALWIGVLKTKTTDATKLGDALLNIGFVPDQEVIGIEEVAACPGQQPASTGPDIIWEASTGEIQQGEPEYIRLLLESDTTRGLSQQGVARVRLPHEFTRLGLFVPSDPYLLGTGAFPPELEDKEQATNLLFWLRASRRDSGSLIRVLYVGINATEVVQTRTANPEFLGIGTGGANQAYTLVHTPVIAGSALLQVEEDERWVDWQAVDGFEASTESSRHYVLDPEAGSVRFGNGVKGKAPQIGQRIRARSYRYGGGPDSNVGAKAITKLDAFPAVKGENPLPARGGARAESIVEALDRVPGEIRRRDRAVTVGDFEELALATPGASVGRADCIPLLDPHTKQGNAAGVVSVVVWPQEDRKHPGAPVPDRTLLRQVCCWLDARRLVTTEVYVIPPTYHKVAVAVGLEVKPGYGIEAVRRWVELVIRQYLAPLPPYGPEGRGWPLGRRVYGPEIEAAALQVEGVDFLNGLAVADWDDQSKTWPPAPQGVRLEAWEVPELGEVTVVQGKPLTPGEALGGVKPPTLPVPVPTPKEACD